MAICSAALCAAKSAGRRLDLSKLTAHSGMEAAAPPRCAESLRLSERENAFFKVILGREGWAFAPKDNRVGRIAGYRKGEAFPHRKRQSRRTLRQRQTVIWTALVVGRRTSFGASPTCAVSVVSSNWVHNVAPPSRRHLPASCRRTSSVPVKFSAQPMDSAAAPSAKKQSHLSHLSPLSHAGLLTCLKSLCDNCRF